MEKNLKKNTYVCLHIYLTHFTVYQKLIQHCKSAILQFFLKGGKKENGDFDPNKKPRLKKKE